MIAILAQAQQAAADSANEAYLLWGFILAAAALGLLILELLIPSGGLLGLLCGVSAIGSIIAFFQYDTMFGVSALNFRDGAARSKKRHMRAREPPLLLALNPAGE